ADDLRERGLPEPRRAGEQHMVERLAAPLRRVERDRELLLDALLPDEVGERRRAQRALELLLADVERRRGEDALAHAACLRALRTCSSIGSDSSTPASARSASTSDQPSSTSASRARNEVGSALMLPSFSFSSMITRCAVLRPMPGIASKRAVSSRAI